MRPVYYDSEGNFHPERRLGCIACPLQSRKNLIEEYKRYPKFIKAELRALDKYQKDKPESTSATRFHNPWNQMFYHIFCDNLEQYEGYIGGGLVR